MISLNVRLLLFYNHILYVDKTVSVTVLNNIRWAEISEKALKGVYNLVPRARDPLGRETEGSGSSWKIFPSMRQIISLRGHVEIA